MPNQTKDQATPDLTPKDRLPASAFSALFFAIPHGLDAARAPSAARTQPKDERKLAEEVARLDAILMAAE
jgi:hypothetical protein